MRGFVSFVLRKSGLDRWLDPLGNAQRRGMRCGKGVTLAGKFGTSFGSEPYLIELRDEVRLSGNVTFLTHDGGTWAFRDIDKYRDVAKFGKIVIGERTFVGYGVTIMPGVQIGKRCVIGAGALVTKDVPDETVVAGIPAKVICSTWEYAEKCKMHSDREYDAEALKGNKQRYLCEKFFGGG